MSYSKMEFERDNPDPFERCKVCGEFTDDCICGDVATETGRVFYPGEETELFDALDRYLTRAPEHPDDVDDDSPDSRRVSTLLRRVFGRGDLARSRIDAMWGRISIAIEDLAKVNLLIREVWPHSRMVEK